MRQEGPPLTCMAAARTCLAETRRALERHRSQADSSTAGTSEAAHPRDSDDGQRTRSRSRSHERTRLAIVGVCMLVLRLITQVKTSLLYGSLPQPPCTPDIVPMSHR